jgi:cysteine desulfurase family protein
VIYLDHAATSWPKPRSVIAAVVRAMEAEGGNPGRGSHPLAERAVERILECRVALAELFHIANLLRICFTANATEALNLALKGLLKAGDHAVCSSMEHNAVWRPLVELSSQGVQFAIAPAQEDGRVAPASVLQALRPETRVIVLPHASNVNGAVNPIAEIGSLARERKIPLLVDASQTAGSLPIDVEAMQIDLLAFPGHKGLLGPQGTGGLFIREPLLLEALKVGGTGSNSSSPFVPDYVPDRYESGTLNTPGIAGLEAGVRHILEQGVEEIQRREWRLTRRLLEGLAGAPRLRLYGPPSSTLRAPVVSFNLGGKDPVVVAEQLDRKYGVACRPGLHCAYLAHRTLGTEKTGTVRFSLGYCTTEREIDEAIRAVRWVAEQ